jgi:hypothetical protein
VQYAEEDGSLDVEPEAALGHKSVQHVGDAQLIPDPAEQQRAADAPGRGGERAVILFERVEQQHLIGELGARCQQRRQGAGGGELVGAAEIGDHRLAHGTIDAPVLDDLQIAALTGLLDAEEHRSAPIGAPRQHGNLSISS